MDSVQQRQAARQFVADWAGRGDEKQDAQNFWRQLLQRVFGVEEPEKAISFEYRVKNDQTGSTIFIDGYIHDTSVLIEQKSFDVDLSKGYRQSDGSMMTPFQQARRYAGLLPHNMNPRWIMVAFLVDTETRTFGRKWNENLIWMGQITRSTDVSLVLDRKDFGAYKLNLKRRDCFYDSPSSVCIYVLLPGCITMILFSTKNFC
jgi:hypothetical protein